MDLKKGIDIKVIHDKSQLDDDENSTICSSETENITDPLPITAIDIIKLLSSYNLISAFPNLYIAYKYLCTIPEISISSQRSFSTLKLIKTRLCSTMKQCLLEQLMILSWEKGIEISLDKAVNRYAKSSKLLQEELLFK